VVWFARRQGSLEKDVFDRPTRPREMVWYARRQGSLEKDVFDRPTALLWEESRTHVSIISSMREELRPDVRVSSRPVIGIAPVLPKMPS